MPRIEEASPEDFWSNNPCGVDGHFDEVSTQRYVLEPYLPGHLKEISSKISNSDKFLEIGIGQGTDALYMCSLFHPTVTYIGIDYSEKSVELALRHRDNCIENERLSCKPIFEKGNALLLNFKDDHFDFVYSMGVLHHIHDMPSSINEVHRVLKKGGKATIYLYRSGSLKVEIAKFLRKVQKAMDYIFGAEKFFYSLLKYKKSKIFGTMFLECFGVPELQSVNKTQINKLFCEFSSVSAEPCGLNIHFLHKTNNGSKNKLGYFYKIDLVK